MQYWKLVKTLLNFLKKKLQDDRFFKKNIETMTN
jgi:hypothetical protein